MFGLQFHPEVSHTRAAAASCATPLRDLRLLGNWRLESFIDQTVAT